MSLTILSWYSEACKEPKLLGQKYLIWQNVNTSRSLRHRYFILSGSVHSIFSLHRIFQVQLLAFLKEWLIFHSKENAYKIEYFFLIKILVSSSATLVTS